VTFEPVPWFVGGGAEVSAETARVLAYQACRGNGGIGGPDDLKVTAFTVPGAGVNYGPGIVSCISHAPAQTYQAYTGRNTQQGTAPVTGTTGSGTRYHLVCAHVQDPYVDPAYGEPTNPKVGPYIELSVIYDFYPGAGYGTPQATADLIESQGLTAEGLAMITVPANTATITQAMITDVRRVANPRRVAERVHLTSTSDDTLNLASFEQFPNGIIYDLYVPKWATVAKVYGFVEGLRKTKSGTGELRVGIRDTTLGTKGTTINEPAPAGVDRVSYNVGGTITIPSNLRGTVCRFEVQGRYTTTVATSSGFLSTDTYSSGMLDITLEERAL